jgi:hypothetical protein
MAMELRARSKSKRDPAFSRKLIPGSAYSLAERLAEVQSLREQVEKAEARRRLRLRNTLHDIDQSASVGLF